MPGALCNRHKLHEFTGPADEEVRRYFQPGDLGEIRMGIRVQRVHEQRIDMRAAKLAGRQRDIVNDDQLRLTVTGPVVTVR